MPETLEYLLVEDAPPAAVITLNRPKRSMLFRPGS
jgi:hypothetical protein